MRIAALSVCLAMSGCASFPQLPAFKTTRSISYVAPEINPVESEAVAKDMAAFLAIQLPPARTTIELEPSRSLLDEVLADELALKGFGVVGPGTGSTTPTQVRYFVTPLDGGILLRIRCSRLISGKYYSRRADGSLVLSGVYSVREIAK